MLVRVTDLVGPYYTLVGMWIERERGRWHWQGCLHVSSHQAAAVYRTPNGMPARAKSDKRLVGREGQSTEVFEGTGETGPSFPRPYGAHACFTAGPGAVPSFSSVVHPHASSWEWIDLLSPWRLRHQPGLWTKRLVLHWSRSDLGHDTRYCTWS